MKIVYFAWLREKTGLSEEDVNPPAAVADVAALVEWLKQRGSGFGDAFKDMSLVRVAVNLEYVQTDHPISPNDEVAFFPPVTGG